MKPVFKDGQWIKQVQHITAGNASQLSDGAAVTVLMSGEQAKRRGLQPLGIYRGFAVAGCKPDEMGIGPVFAIPKLLERNSLKVSDIGLRSEEHTSELPVTNAHLVCRLLLEKKKK